MERGSRLADGPIEINKKVFALGDEFGPFEETENKQTKNRELQETGVRVGE